MRDGPGAVPAGRRRRMPGMTAGDGAPAGFVGRERELEAILEAAAAAGVGRAGSILVEAPSGMGASRLIAEAVARITAGDAGLPDVAVLRGGGLPDWRGTPYSPFRDALDRFLSLREPDAVARLLGSGAELLLPLLPGVAAQLPGAPVGPASRERLAERVNEAVRGTLGRLAADHPVVLVLEDLHVLDAASRALLSFLCRTLGERRILVVGSYQPDALGRGHPLRSTLDAIAAGPRPVRHVALPPLDRAALRALITSREGDAPSAPTLLLVAERSGGSPVVAEEVLTARRELSGASLAVPLDQLVTARATRRTPECRRILRILAVADGPLVPAQLGAVAAAYDAGMGRPAPRSVGARRRGGDGLDGDLSAGVVEAIEHGFVEAVGDGRPTPGPSSSRSRGRGAVVADRPLRIRHELVAAALAADLLPGPRRRMHAAVASALAEHPAESGRHWHHAHEAGHELRAEVDAAGEAERIGAAADALVHLERAIELAGAPVAAGVVSTAEEFDLLIRAAEASAASGDAGRAEAFLMAAMARPPDPSDRSARAELFERLGAYRLAGGDREGAIAEFERALDLLPRGPGVGRARLLATFAQVRMLEGSFSEAVTLAEEALEVAAGAGPEARAWVGHATCTLGVVGGWLGRTDLAVARLQQALEIATALGRLDDAFRARANLTTVLDIVGRREDAVEVAREGIAASEAAGMEVAHGNLLRGNAADVLISLGRWREARELAERALDWAPAGTPFVNAALELAVIETETTAGEAAARLLGRLFLEIETIPDSQFAAPAYQAAASLALWRGDTSDALRAAQSAWERVWRTEDWALAARIATTALAVADVRVREALERRDTAEAVRIRRWGEGILQAAARLVAESGAAVDARLRVEADADLATTTAFAARIRGHDDPATWADVAARWRAVGRPYEEARALHRQAEAHLETASLAGHGREGRDEARAPLLAAVGITVDLGAIQLLRRLADVAARARIPLPEPAAEALSTADRPVEPEPVAAGSVALRGDRASRGLQDPATSRRTAASFGLSPREQGVLAEVVAGRTNREIGRRLFISEKTVGVHVGNILAKLGVGGRVEAATVALRLGLVDGLLEGTKKPGPRGPGFEERRRGGAA